MGEVTTVNTADLIAWHNERAADVRAKIAQITVAQQAPDASSPEHAETIEYATARVRGRAHELADFAGWLVAHAADTAGQLDTLPEEFLDTTE